MSSKERHKITWFRRDDAGIWQWQGFRDDLSTQEQINAWVEKQSEEAETIEAEGGTPNEIFILDLEGANQMLAELMLAAQELDDLKEWLDDVVQIEKITVETEFAEWREQKYSDEEDEE